MKCWISVHDDEILPGVEGVAPTVHEMMGEEVATADEEEVCFQA